MRSGSGVRRHEPYRPAVEPLRQVHIHFRCSAFSGKSAELLCQVPLTPLAASTLERQLQQELQLPQFVTVFSIVRSDEARFAPPLPLLLLHGIIDASECAVAVDVVVRPIIQSHFFGHATRPSLPPPLPVAALLSGRHAAMVGGGDDSQLRELGAVLLARLRRDAVVRLLADDTLAAALACCYGRLPTFFGQPVNEKARLHCSVAPPEDAGEASDKASGEEDKAYAGMGDDSGREWLQCRRRYDEGDVAGCGCLPDGTPPEFAAAFDGLRSLAAACLHALALSVGADPVEWLSLCDLDDEQGRRPPPQTSYIAAACRAGGPSVFRLYRYLPAGSGSGCHAHSDLGLLTLSPAPTVPGLLVYDSEALEWYEAEEGLRQGEITLFCGEQLSFLSAGALPAPLHRVPAPPSDGVTRYSMPFFARAHPEATLVPLGSSGSGSRQKYTSAEHVGQGKGCGSTSPLAPTRCDDFVLRQLFRRRPWRQLKAEGGGTPDY